MVKLILNHWPKKQKAPETYSCPEGLSLSLWSGVAQGLGSSGTGLCATEGLQEVKGLSLSMLLDLSPWPPLCVACLLNSTPHIGFTRKIPVNC